MSISTLETVTDRAKWLEDRKSSLGASESPAALGLSPWLSPRGLYLRKLGLVEDEPPNISMRVGLALESLLAELYQESSGREITNQQVVIRCGQPYPFLSATLDAVTESGIVEFKTISERKGHEIGPDGSDSLPDSWLIQAHQQMYIHGEDRVDFGVLIGNTEFRRLTVHRNENLLGAMLPRLEAFWGCVTAKRPPVETAESDARLMHVLYPQCEGGIDLTDEDGQEVGEWLAAKSHEGTSKKTKDQIKSRLLEKLGNASYGRLPDGRLLTRKVVNVRERTQTVKGYSFVDLRIKESETEGD